MAVVSRADYAHWNEDADRIWWEEEGKHAESDHEAWREDEYSAADAFAEELGEMETAELHSMLADTVYIQRWPKARPLIERELKLR